MAARRYWLSLLTMIALIVPALVVIPQAARAQELEYVVDTLNDDEPPPSGSYCLPATVGDCSLRRALTLANSDGVASKIVFASTLNGPINVNPIKPLPTIGTNTTIDGLANSVPQAVRIEINGGGASFAAFRINGAGNRIQGLSIYGFSGIGVFPGGSGIWIDGPNATSNTIFLNYIGLNRNLGLATGNFNGILISGGANQNTIEGGNFISNNANNGILIAGARRNTIRGNIIGLRSQGGAAATAGNGQFGIQITTDSFLGASSAENIIGDSSPNIISANGESGSVIRAGILLRTSGTVSTTISGNFIGTGFSGAGSFGNNGDGIRIEEGAANNDIFGSAGALMVSSANSAYGLRITGAGTSGNEVRGVYIGTDESASSARANLRGGILIDDGASSNTILSVAGAPTIIAGNTGPGVIISGAGTSGNSVQGSLVGIAPDPDTTNGTLDIPNAGGILVERRAQFTLISGNTVSANDTYGIRLSSALSSTVQANMVGLNLARTGTSPNLGPGIAVAESRNALIGGAGRSLGNTIGGNNGPGIVITGTTTLSTTVDGNQIGLRRSVLDGDFNAGAANGVESVLVADGPRLTTIGGSVGNIIGGNTDDAGISIVGSGTTTTTISLNQIGWLANGTSPPIQLPTGDGIAITGTRAVSITNNSVRFANGSAVLVSNATDVTISENTALSESTGDGVQVEGTSLNVDVLDNTLRANGGDAVLVRAGSRQVAVQNNRMAANGGAISLLDTTAYDGSPPDTASPGANHDIDPPFGLRVTQSGQISGFVYTSTVKIEAGLSPVSACITCTIEVFRPDPSLAAPDGQGWERLRVEQGGSTDDRITQFGEDGSFVAQLAGPLPKQLLLAATDGFGNTSQFAVFNPSAGITLTPLNPSPAAQNAVPGQTITYTFDLANIGTLDLNNLQFQRSNSPWTVQLFPPVGPLSLGAGASRTLTVTLTLPTGSDPSVQVPKIDTTTITVTSAGLVTETEQLVTTVLARPVLRVAPASGTGRGKPGDQVSYQHRVFNDGNIPVTVRLQARTVDPADSGRIWTTTLNNSTEPLLVTIQPGLFTDVSVGVRVPSTAQVVDSQGNPVSATTFITGTVDAFPAITLPFSDTTRVSLRTAAEMVQNEEQDGAAGGTVTFFHTVTNTSNGVASFRLNVQANFGSQVTFSSDDVVITNNTFSLDNVFQPPTRRNIMTLRVTVTVNQRLLPGDTETITIFLTDPITNESIGGATVVDRINIRTGLRLPRIWIPLVVAN